MTEESKQNFPEIAYMSLKEKNEALLEAASKGDLMDVIALLKSGADIECQSYDENTPLGLAAQEGHVSVVGELLRRGANQNHLNGRGKTPFARGVKTLLEEALAKKDWKTAKLLLEENSAVNTVSHFRFASDYDYCQAAELLLFAQRFKENYFKALQDENRPLMGKQIGDDVRQMWEEILKESVSAIDEKYRGNHERILSFLKRKIEKYGQDLFALQIVVDTILQVFLRSFTDDVNNNHFMYSKFMMFRTRITQGTRVVQPMGAAAVDLVEESKEDTVMPVDSVSAVSDEQMRLDMAEFQALTPKEKNNKLFDAISTGKLDFVKFFYEYGVVGADITNEAIYAAASYGHLDIVKFLFKQEGVDVDFGYQDTYGQTSLCVAAMYGHLNVVKFLSEQAHANIEHQDGSGQTPLFLAATYGKEGVVNFLLDEKNARADHVDKKGNSLLHQWAESRSLDGTNLRIAKYVLDKAPELIYVKNQKRETAREVACRKDRRRADRFLWEFELRLAVANKDEVKINDLLLQADSVVLARFYSLLPLFKIALAEENWESARLLVQDNPAIDAVLSFRTDGAACYQQAVTFLSFAECLERNHATALVQEENFPLITKQIDNELLQMWKEIMRDTFLITDKESREMNENNIKILLFLEKTIHARGHNFLVFKVVVDILLETTFLHNPRLVALKKKIEEIQFPAPVEVAAANSSVEESKQDGIAPSVDLKSTSAGGMLERFLKWGRSVWDTPVPAPVPARQIQEAAAVDTTVDQPGKMEWGM